jgi:uncharacterized protein YutE (UPF0331/DUF86 family)
MILKKDQKSDIVRRIDFIQIQLSDLKKFTKLDWTTYQKDRDTQRNVERLAENIANATIDVCKIIIVGEDVEIPNSYREVVQKLGEVGVLEEGLALDVADYVVLRNVLAHQYLDIKWSKIKDFIVRAPQVVPKFIESIKKRF